ncbi:MAG: hypothetical protein U5N10_19610 [Gemmobacter sp.]|nr:hypothetical protein [Gemmobacter sp.]
MKIGIIGAGAFGAALAIALGRGKGEVRCFGRATRWFRIPWLCREIAAICPGGFTLPELGFGDLPIWPIWPGTDLAAAVPMQALGRVSGAACARRCRTEALVACCKGVDLATLAGAQRR